MSVVGLRVNHYPYVILFSFLVQLILTKSVGTSITVCLGITIVLVALTSREDLEKIRGTLRGVPSVASPSVPSLEKQNTAIFQQTRELLHAKKLDPASPKMDYGGKNLKKDFKVSNANATVFQEDAHEKGMF
jgi:hypothetical protein